MSRSISARLLCLLTTSVLVSVIPALAVDRLTDNLRQDFYGANHLATYDGQVLWVADDEDVFHFDGTTTIPVQQFDAGDPSLDLVGSFVFSLGGGALPGEVIGGWRRGAGYAWIYTSGQPPVAVDTAAANQFDPGVRTNPEGVAIADGCVFMIFQANDGGQVVNHAFQVDPATGAVTPISGAASIAGVNELRTDECEAVFVLDPNSDAVSGLPLQLMHFDGTQTVTVDSGPIDPTEIGFHDGKVVYVRTALGTPQVFLLDLDEASPQPRQISFNERRKRNPQIDGDHIVWGEVAVDGSVDIALHGGLYLTHTARNRALVSGPFPFVLSEGQLAWKTVPGRLRHYADGVRYSVDIDPAIEVKQPQLSKGRIAFYGKADDGGADDEVFLYTYTGPGGDAAGSMLAVVPGLAPPPLLVDVEIGPGRAVLRWDEVLTAHHFNVYYAEEPGVTPDNYQTLQGGTRLEGVRSPLTISGLATHNESYYFIVTSVDATGGENPSREATKTVFSVDTTIDLPDAAVGDLDCRSTSNQCTLRAAVEEASWIGGDVSIALPGGMFFLDLPPASGGGPLQITSHLRIIGGSRGSTIIDGAGLDRVLEVTPDPELPRVRLTDLTIRGGAGQGLRNSGALVMERVRVTGNGSPGKSFVGAGIESGSESIELIDCEIDSNWTNSHGGGLFLGGANDRVVSVLRRTTVHDNVSGIGGGGIYAFGSGSVAVIDSVIHDNSSANSQNWPGGGIYKESGRLKVTGSAFFMNVSPAEGGAFYTFSGDNTLFVNSSISNNQADLQGGGLHVTGGTIQLRNISMYNNLSGSGITNLSLTNPATAVIHNSIFESTSGFNCSATGIITSEGFNIDSADDCGFGPDDLVNTDPMINGLADIGGFTPSHALLPGSPARDGGDPAGCSGDAFGSLLAADQRGAKRPFDGDGDGTARCDSGSVEDLGACQDGDGDTFGSFANPLCGGGLSADCDDGDGAVYPGAAQVCDGVNNDCSHFAWPALDSTNELDGDGDGLSTCAGDCSDADQTAWATPGETGTFEFVDNLQFGWSPPSNPGGLVNALSYDVKRYEAGLGEGFVSGATCISTATPATGAFDAATPPLGKVFLYLSRALNACPAGAGDGTWGVDSNGIERLLGSCP